MQVARCSILLVVVLAVGCDLALQKQLTNNEDTQTQQPADSLQPGERKVAEVGDGAKGRNYGGGLITEPASQYWKIKERLAYDVAVTHALQLYKALNDFKAPKTHEEFMEKIIKDNKIKLPQLPPGRKYVYDPEQEKLMIEREAP